MTQETDRNPSCEGAPCNVPPGAELSRRNVCMAAVIGGFLLLAVVLVFGRTVGYEFVNYDDDQYVSDNPRLTRGLSTEGIAWAFTTTRCGNWHPVTWLSYLLDYQLYGLDPWGYHLTNVLLHAATAILLFLVLWRMTGDLWPSAFVAAVFAIHPLRAESVAWVSERKDVLSGLFFMLTLAAYVGYVRRPFSWLRYLTVALLMALGLLAKPMLVTLPLVLLLLDYWPLGRVALPLWSQKNGWLVIEKLPLLALSAVSCVLTPWAQGTALAQLDRLPLSVRIGNALVSYATYLGQFFYPAELAVYYPHPVHGLPVWQIAGATLLLAMISAGVVVWGQRSRYLVVGWLWYLGMLVPVIGLVQVGRQAMADRYTYLPQIGLAIALAWAAKSLLPSLPHRAWAWGAASAVVLAALMGCAWQQTAYWHDSETLWTHALACTSSNVVAHTNLGLALSSRHRDDEAAAEYGRALAIRPDDVKAHVNLGIVLYRKGQVGESLTHLRQAVEFQPDDAVAHNNLAIVLLGQRQTDEAIAHFRKALQLEPDYPDAHNNLGATLAQAGRLEEAAAHFQAALELKPNYAEADCNLGNVLASCGRLDEAIERFEQALKLKPDYARARVNLDAARSQREEILAGKQRRARMPVLPPR